MRCLRYTEWGNSISQWKTAAGRSPNLAETHNIIDKCQKNFCFDFDIIAENSIETPIEKADYSIKMQQKGNPNIFSVFKSLYNNEYQWWVQ